MTTDWLVLPHGDLRLIAPGLWQVAGSLPWGRMPRNMTVYQLPSGGLLLHSVVALDTERQKQLEALGRPEVMVVPNGMHRLDAARYKKRYPGLKVVCPAGAREAVQKKVAVDATSEEVLPGYGIICHVPDGVKPVELTYELRLGTGHALLFTDVLMNMSHMDGLDGWLLRLLGSTGSLRMTPIGKFLLLKNKARFCQWLLAQSERPDLQAIVVSHGEAVTEDVGAQLKEAAGRL